MCKNVPSLDFRHYVLLYILVLINNELDLLSRGYNPLRHHMQVNNIHFFSQFCEEHNLPRTTLLRLEKEPHRQFHLEWLSLMVSLGYSAHWLLTGEGEMKNKS